MMIGLSWEIGVADWGSKASEANSQVESTWQCRHAKGSLVQCTAG